MIFRTATLFILIDTAFAAVPAMKKFDNSKLQNSKLAKTLSRHLEDEGISFLSEFNVLYQNCLPSSNSISFKLCPGNDKCENGCENGGEYTVDFDEFLDAFTEMQMDEHEYRCEMIRENCENDDAEACYEAAGYYDECYGQDQNDDEYKLQQYFECAQYEGYDNIWVKPVCYDTINIHLGIYADEDCGEEYSVDNWDADEMGEEFPDIPYSIASGDPIIYDQCVECKEYSDEDNNGGNDAEDENEVIEQCEQLFGDRTYSCETEYMYENIDGLSADQSGCGKIQKMQQAEEGFQYQPSKRSSKSSSKAVFGVILGLVAISAVAGVAYHYYGKKKEDTVVETKPSRFKRLI